MVTLQHKQIQREREKNRKKDNEYLIAKIIYDDDDNDNYEYEYDVDGEEKKHKTQQMFFALLSFRRFGSKYTWPVHTYERKITN